MAAPTICTPWFDATDLTCDASTPEASGLPAAAIDWVFAATGYRYTGECTSTLRPVLPCGHTTGCGCRTRHERIDLTQWIQGPVTAITDVTIDGVTVDPAHYELHNRRYLVALRPADATLDPALIPWPIQDLTHATDGEDTWTVTVTHGALPPESVMWAARTLACQLVRKQTTGDCDLPDNATSVSDNGVTISLNVPTDGRTGIPSIDAVLDLHGGANGPRTRRMIDPTTGIAPVTPA